MCVSLVGWLVGIVIRKEIVHGVENAEKAKELFWGRTLLPQSNPAVLYRPYDF